MANTIMGTGLLALPRCISLAGLVPGLLLIVLSALINVGTNVFLSDAAAVGGHPASFNKLAVAAGGPALALVTDAAVVANALGAGITYAIVAADGLTLGMPLLLGAASPGHQAWVLVVAAIITPLSLLRSLDALRLTSLLAVLILGGISGLVLLYALPASGPAADLDPCPADRTASPVSCPPGEVRLFTSPAGVLAALPTLVMAYGCQMSTPTLWNEMERPTRPRMLALYASALGTAMLLYLLVGGLGYATFGDAVAGNILKSYPATLAVGAARLGLALVVIFSFPIQALALRQSAASIASELRACGGAGRRRAPARAVRQSPLPEPAPAAPEGLFELSPHLATPTAGFVLVATALAAAGVQIGIVVDVAGSLGASTVSIISPAIIYARTFPHDRFVPLAHCAVALGLLVMVTGLAGVLSPTQ
mmetsp:Transcript_20527/g.66681  ORF Transcript_20527/g.66681 Transcript_20527/m.66681 type:complete len:423 (-) Transcript_20527:78-1346(-)